MAWMPYLIRQIAQNEVVGDEQLGTKTKFWFERDVVRWLFKEARGISNPIRSKSRR